MQCAIQSVSGFINSPVSASTPSALLNPATLTTVSIPVGALVTAIYLHAGAAITADSNSTISVGYTGNTDAILPASAACTTNTLNAGDVRYPVAGLMSSLDSTKGLMLNSSANITAGQIQCVISYTAWGNLPY